MTLSEFVMHNTAPTAGMNAHLTKLMNIAKVISKGSRLAAHAGQERPSHSKGNRNS